MSSSHVITAFSDDYDSGRRINRAVLPTAPRAARGPDVNMDSVPTEPPFTAFLGNLPFDVDEVEIENFFNGLAVRLVYWSIVA